MDALSRVVLRPPAAADAEEMADLHIAAWEEAYAGLLPESVFAQRRAHRAEHVARWRRIARDSPSSTTVAVHDDTPIGFVSVGPPREDDVEVPEELWALYVRAAWWGRGLGHRLLTHALADRPAYLWLLRGNDRGEGFYRRHGFVLDGATRENTSCDTEVRMVRRSA